jgi:DNA recombination-dependent growth factor C
LKLIAGMEQKTNGENRDALEQYKVIKIGKKILPSENSAWELSVRKNVSHLTLDFNHSTACFVG